jgi:hypothetical protein
MCELVKNFSFLDEKNVLRKCVIFDDKDDKVKLFLKIETNFVVLVFTQHDVDYQKILCRQKIFPTRAGFWAGGHVKYTGIQKFFFLCDLAAFVSKKKKRWCVCKTHVDDEFFSFLKQAEFPCVTYKIVLLKFFEMSDSYEEKICANRKKFFLSQKSYSFLSLVNILRPNCVVDTKLFKKEKIFSDECVENVLSHFKRLKYFSREILFFQQSTKLQIFSPVLIADERCFEVLFKFFLPSKFFQIREMEPMLNVETIC